MAGYYGWRPYVSAAERRRRALREMEKLRKKGKTIEGVEAVGRNIAETFWGQAWCGHLEKFSDYANRLPRGRTYVRNGSVCHLEIGAGRIHALVMGSELYTVDVKVAALAADRWREIKKRCARKIGSLVELLEGKLSGGVMEVVTDRDRGLFPLPRQIRMSCSCPDWAGMCKHVAAAMYGAGARLDDKPELLFRLRGVDAGELVAAEADALVGRKGRSRRIAEDDVSGVFGIELADGPKRPARRRVAALRRRSR